jgi:hypothetical protein
MDDPDLADQLAEQGRKRALREFSSERYARQIVDLLAEVTSVASVQHESRNRGSLEDLANKKTARAGMTIWPRRRRRTFPESR